MREQDGVRLVAHPAFKRQRVPALYFSCVSHSKGTGYCQVGGTVGPQAKYKVVITVVIAEEEVVTTASSRVTVRGVAVGVRSHPQLIVS